MVRTDKPLNAMSLGHKMVRYVKVSREIAEVKTKAVELLAERDRLGDELRKYIEVENLSALFNGEKPKPVESAPIRRVVAKVVPPPAKKVVKRHKQESRSAWQKPLLSFLKSKGQASCRDYAKHAKIKYVSAYWRLRELVNARKVISGRDAFTRSVHYSAL